MTNQWGPIRIGDLELEHRLAMAPMTRSRAIAAGVPTALTAGYYAQRASMGFIITEGTQRSIDGRGYSRTPGVLSSNANRRTDRYGGSRENRIRFAIEVATAIAAADVQEQVGTRHARKLKCCAAPTSLRVAAGQRAEVDDPRQPRACPDLRNWAQLIALVNRAEANTAEYRLGTGHGSEHVRTALVAEGLLDAVSARGRLGVDARGSDTDPQATRHGPDRDAKGASRECLAIRAMADSHHCRVNLGLVANCAAVTGSCDVHGPSR